MAEEEDGPIVIGSDDEFSDNDDVVVTKIEIEVDSEDVIFLSETKAPPKLERELSPVTNSEAGTETVNGGKSLAPPALNRSTSVTTEAARLSLEDSAKEKTNNSGPALDTSVFCSVPAPLDLSAKHSVSDNSNHSDDTGDVTSTSNQILSPVDQLKCLAQSLIPVSEAEKSVMDTNPLLGNNSGLAGDTSVQKQTDQAVVVTQATSTDRLYFTGLCGNRYGLGTDQLSSVFPTCLTNSMPLMSDFTSCNMQTLLCNNNSSLKSSPPTQQGSANDKNIVNISVPSSLSQTTSVITHSSVAGSHILSHTSIAGSSSSMSVSSVITTNVMTPITSGTLTGRTPGMSPTGNIPKSSASKTDPFAASHLLLASLDSPWLNGSQTGSVFHPTSTSCCIKTGALTGSQACTHGCQPSQTGLCDKLVTVSQSAGCVGGLPGGSLTSLTNNPLKRSLSTSDKTCMYNSLTLPLAMQNPNMKHSASMNNILVPGSYLSGQRDSENKVTRHNSLSSRTSPLFNDSAIPLPPKKQKRCYSQEGPRINCTNCSCLLVGEEFSQCPSGHSTCSRCLKERVKLVLSGKEKESIKCLNRQCDSFYPMSELKLTLSPFVVEILEEKLDSEMIADMIMKNAESSEDPDEDYEMDTETASAGCDNSVKKEKFLKKYDDMPDYWDPMDERVVGKSGYEMVRLEPRSLEYEDIVAKFFESMVDSNVEVVHVHRVQNPIQWKYYTVKKAEMTQDNDGFGCVEEQQLFHGTNSSVVEAICRKGFDWRLCGKHGTMYGQGSYFALNASYSHQYTDLRQSKRMGAISSTMMSTNPFTMTLPTQPSYIYPPVAPVIVNFGPFRASAATSQNSAFSALNLSSQSTQTTPSGLPQNSNFVSQSGSNVSTSNQQHNTSSNSNLVFPSTSTGIRRSFCGVQNNVPVSSQIVQTGNQTNNGAGTGQTGGHICPITNNKKPYRFCKLKVNPKPAHIRQVSGLASAKIGSSSGIMTRPTAKMFLAKVLVGKYVGGESKYRKPPPLEPKSDPFGKCYDSCVDDIRNPKIFVIFDSAQAYPEYLLEYTYM